MSRQSVVMVVSRCANQSHYGAQQIVNIIITRLQVSGPQSPSVLDTGTRAAVTLITAITATRLVL